MKVFFSGEQNISAGPANVNKLLKKELEKLSQEELSGKHFSYITQKNIVLKQLEVIWKTIVSDVIIYSGTLHVNIISVSLAKLLRKKNIYIMHGCVQFESTVNEEPNPSGLRIEEAHMEAANLICGVSKSFMDWTKERYPEYKGKVSFLPNGIDWDIYNKKRVIPGCEKKQQIVVMGGDRRIKMNLQVCQAVQLINEETGSDLHVIIFGRDSGNEYSQSIRNVPCADMRGNRPHEEVLDELGRSILYVQNSRLESFGLAVIEALMCGCGIVISADVGAKSIFDIEQRFVIEDCADINQIKSAILEGLSYNNNQDVMSSVNKERTSGTSSAKRLLSLIDDLVE